MVLRLTKHALLAACALALLSVPARSFVPVGRGRNASSRIRSVELSASSSNDEYLDRDVSHRRRFLTAAASTLSAAAAALSVSPRAALAADVEGESIAARAARLSKVVESTQEEQGEREMPSVPPSSSRVADDRTVWDFDLPVAGVPTSMKELVRQEYNGPDGEGKVKAILVVNIKQDDVVARKNIPELIALASKYGRQGEFAVVCCPTDQGYYEPDTSQLLRLKLASEYGYGINPATVVTDKVNLLGTGAHPFWRWIQGTARTPEGLGRIRGNFEKFLVDGRTGKPVRRYPRRYEPKDIQDDIEALIAGRPLPPAGANWREQWRAAAKESEADTYRFQKGLNVFDQ